MNIALFGGSFDPIHDGHLQVALHVLRHTHVNEVWFVCAMLSPHKEQTTADFEDRVALIKAMIKPYRKLKVCTIEQTLPIPSKTLHTVQALKRQYPKVNFSWVMGEDQFESFSSWYEPEILKASIDFIGVSRTHQQPSHDAKTWIHMHHPASASSFREQHDLIHIPMRVRKVMLKRGVYLKPLLVQDMSLKRFEHTLRVKAMAINLAKAHNLDQSKASMSALLHDVAKGMSENEMDCWIQRSKYRHLSIPEYAKHAFAGAMIAKHRYGLVDKKSLKAIVHHTEGTSSSSLSQCLFVADKIEPARPLWLVALKSTAMMNLALTTTLIKKGFSDDT